MTTGTELSKSQKFVARLRNLEKGPRAELRRALMLGDPSLDTAIFRYVEPFRPGHGLPNENWYRKCYYLVASLFGLTEGEDDSGKEMSLARAVRFYDLNGEPPGDEPSSVEKRFLALLDADRDELAHRLRQMLRMITSGASRVDCLIDWAQLLDDLILWNNPNRHAQTRWAKDFFHYYQEKKEVNS